MTDYTDYFKKNPHKIKRLSGNLCWGRSGSYLMCTLFDSHPEVLTLPPHSYAVCTTFITNFLPSFENTSTKEIVAALYKFFPTTTIEGNFEERWSLVNADGSFLAKIGDDEELNLGVPEEKYLEALTEIIDNIKKFEIKPSTSVLLNAIHIAYAAASGHGIKTKNPLIFLSLHGRMEEVLRLLHDEYEEFCLIINSRDPAKTYDSHLYHHLFENKIPEPITVLPILLNHYVKDGQQVLDREGKPMNALSIRFEDMHQFPEETMRALSQKLGLEWHVSLLSSTINGKIMWIQRNGKLYTGVNHRSSQDAKFKLLKNLDIYFIQDLLDVYYRKWGYEKKKFSSIQKAIYSLIIRFFPQLIPSYRKTLFLGLKKNLPRPIGVLRIIKAYIKFYFFIQRLVIDKNKITLDNVPSIYDAEKR